MSFNSVAAQLYNVKSRKNVSFSTAFGMMVREELAARTSVFNLVRIATGSTLLATIAQAKYGKKTPIEQEEEKQAKKQAELDKRFKMFTVSSIANLSKRVSLSEEITKRNTAMILNLYNDIGYSRIRKRVNPANIRNLSSVRVPIVSRTVVGEIDELKKQIEELEKLKRVKPKLQTASEKKKKKKEKEEETKSDSVSLLSGLLANPKILKFLATRLIPMVGAGVVTALGVVSGAPSRTIDRLMGKKPTWINPETNKEEPLPEWLDQVTREYDPAVTGVTAAAATVLGAGAIAGAYRLGKGAVGVARNARDGFANIRNRFRSPASPPAAPVMPTATPVAPTNVQAGGLSQFAGLNKRQLTTGATGNRVASMLGISKKRLEKMTVREIRAALKNATPSPVATTTAAPAARVTAPTAPTAPPVTTDNLRRAMDATEQMEKFQKFSRAILKVAKFLAPIKIGLVALEISKMASAIADYGDGKISYSEYKEIMSMGYAQIVDTVGIIAVSTAVGAAGGAIATTYGLGLGAIPGAVIGLGAGIAVDMVVDEDDLLPAGVFIFESIHEGKPPPQQTTQKSAVGAEGGVDVPTQQPITGGVGANWNTSVANAPSYMGGLEVGSIPSVQRIEGEEGVQAILKTIRTKESGNNYNADTSKDPRWIKKAKEEGTKIPTASGAYQFIDATWQGLSRKYGVGFMYQRAVAAPPQIQDKVAELYVNEILAATGGDVSKVPVAWYTGNIQGKLSDVAKRLNYGMSVATYQRAWLQVYSGITGTKINYKPATSSVAPMPTSDGVMPIATGVATSVAAPPSIETTETSTEAAAAAMETRVEDAQITAHAAAIAATQLATSAATLQAGINETRMMVLDPEFPSVNNPMNDKFSQLPKMLNYA